jgi:hypothetical protein
MRLTLLSDNKSTRQPDTKTTRLIAFLAALLDGIIKILDSGAVCEWLTLKPVVIAVHRKSRVTGCSAT